MARHSPDPTGRPGTNSSALLRYRALLILLFPILFLYTIGQAFKARQWRYITQRCGFGCVVPDTTTFWIHAASVGEVNAATPLIRALKQHYPQPGILLTTTTATGAQAAAKLITTHGTDSEMTHCYLPLDYRFAVNRLLRRTSPRCVLVMETEIWPNLFSACRHYNIPLLTINGRLSQRTLQTTGWVKSLYRCVLRNSSLILTRSEQDTKNYVALGAAPEKVKTIGNIKFSAQFNLPKNDSHPFGNRHYVLAASTHDNEEQQIAQFWKQHRDDLKKYLLVIAPRHPQRLAAIREQLEPLQLNVAIRSRNDPVDQSTELYIVDTLGELIRFMYHAEVVFMGGSLVPTGGHNILEPAFLSSAIIFGPYMDNFDDEAQLFLNHDGAIQVKNIHETGKIITALLADEDRRRRLGNNAHALLEKQKNIAERYVAEIDRILESQ
ncbi:MAG: 3-deoxy-D-manno-octulosonic acid transferase [Gammaproteobacteria bacterium]|jgi:3-deoxy-D-manno-octulosonic-acid transferase